MEEPVKKEKEEGKAKISEIVEAIASMNALELSQLVKALEEKFGVTAQMPVAVAPAAAAPSAAPQEAKKEEEPKEVTVVLVDSGDKKLQVIKEIRAITGLPLKEAKDLVDNVPGVIKEKVPIEEAKKIKAQLEKEGAKVEFKY
jgi:large subunit ribosomal protein L7/L12